MYYYLLLSATILLVGIWRPGPSRPNNAMAVHYQFGRGPQCDPPQDRLCNVVPASNTEQGGFLYWQKDGRLCLEIPFSAFNAEAKACLSDTALLLAAPVLVHDTLSATLGVGTKLYIKAGSYPYRIWKERYRITVDTLTEM